MDLFTCTRKIIVGLSRILHSWCNDYKIGTIQKFVTNCGQNEWPVARVGHSVSQVKTKTFIFGGFIKKYGKVLLFHSVVFY